MAYEDQFETDPSAGADGILWYVKRPFEIAFYYGNDEVGPFEAFVVAAGTFLYCLAALAVLTAVTAVLMGPAESVEVATAATGQTPAEMLASYALLFLLLPPTAFIVTAWKVFRGRTR